MYGTILIVDDNVAILTAMKYLLADTFEQVLTTTQPDDILKLMAQQPTDIVLLDMNFSLGVNSGQEGLFWLRAIRKHHPDVPVVLLTARTEEEDRLSGFQTGADDYLTKPFKMRELGIRVDNIIRNRERIRRIFCRQTELPAGTQHCSSPEDRFLERAVRCVLNHLEDGAYDRESFARDMYMSSSSLYNKLRASTGQNISGFVNSIRLKEACRIAREQKGISIAELSERVGYNSPRYFAMCFKKEFGKAPKEFLDQEGGVNGTDAPAAPAPGTGTESLPY